MIKKLFISLLLFIVVPVYAQQDPNSGTTNLINNAITPTDSTSGWNGAGTFGQPITCWAPGEPGYCGPNPALNAWGDNGTTMINFSYGLTDLYQTYDINKILNGYGSNLAVTGFNFNFVAKNGNGWDDGRTDYLKAYLYFYDTTGQELLKYNYDLNYQFNWSSFSFNDAFKEPLSELSTVRLGFVGMDNNFWAGFYGPEVTQISFSLDYTKVQPNCNLSPWLTECLVQSITTSIPKLDTIDILEPIEPIKEQNIETMLTTATAPELISAEVTSIATLTDTKQEQALADNIDKDILGLVLSIATSIPATQTNDVTEDAVVVAQQIDSTDSSQVNSSVDDNATIVSAQNNEEIKAETNLEQIFVSNPTQALTEEQKQMEDNNSNVIPIETSDMSIMVSFEKPKSETTTDLTEEQKQIQDMGDLSQDILMTGVAMNIETQESIQLNALQSVDEANNIASEQSQTSIALANQAIKNSTESNNIDTTESLPEEVKQMMAGNNPNMSTGIDNEENLIKNVLESNNGQTKTFDDGNKSDEEYVMSLVSINNPGLGIPGINPVFNLDSSMADKQASNAFGKNNNNKSDAEKRAEQIIAANKDQQDQINKDYMNADQSGILGAIASDTDVSAYRTVMIPQNVSWYKTDEIYKNVTYKDNVRNSYFLEKGNTDTYNKMVNEQYKK